VNATADFMRETVPQPDFLLFSGDASNSGDVITNILTIQGSLQASRRR
jgi:hypothetical protein